MSNPDWTAKLAEEFWRQAEPAIKRIVIDAVRYGAAAVPPALQDWWASAPIRPAADVHPTPIAPDPVPTVPEPTSTASESAPSAQERVRPADAGAAKVARPKASPRRKRSPRPLKGVSAAAHALVERAGKPLTSRELLGMLREWDGRERTEQRDNTLLAALRRLRNAGWIHWDGTHYSLPAKKPRG